MKQQKESLKNTSTLRNTYRSTISKQQNSVNRIRFEQAHSHFHCTSSQFPVLPNLVPKQHNINNRIQSEGTYSSVPYTALVLRMVIIRCPNSNFNWSTEIMWTLSRVCPLPSFQTGNTANKPDKRCWFQWTYSPVYIPYLCK